MGVTLNEATAQQIVSAVCDAKAEPEPKTNKQLIVSRYWALFDLAQHSHLLPALGEYLLVGQVTSNHVRMPETACCSM